MSAGPGSLVLVIEDDADVSTVYRLHLEMGGFTVVEATTGAEGVDLAAELKPVAIVLDFMLPDIDGIQVMEKLSVSESTSHIPVVMVTARTHRRDERGSPHLPRD